MAEKDMPEEFLRNEYPVLVSVNFGVGLDAIQLEVPEVVPKVPEPEVNDADGAVANSMKFSITETATRKSSWDRASSRSRSTMMSVVKVSVNSGLRRASWSAAAQDAGDFSQFFEGLSEGAEGTCVTGLSPYRIARSVLTIVSSSIVVAVFFAISLALSGLWPVPGHQQATFWTGFMNRLAWAFSPFFLGSFFPGCCNPRLMRNWRIHRYFLIISLLPFIIADVAFPYIVGADTHFKVFFSTCFWPTITCLFFLPSMIAGIRCCRGDLLWPELGLSQWRYMRAGGIHFLKDLSCLVVCFAAAVLPVNYIALDFAVVLPNLNPSTAAWLRPLISTVLKISCFEVFKMAAGHLSSTLRFFGLFPMAVNLGLHTAMSVVLCQDWLSVIIWIGCDFCNSFWRTLRTNRFQFLVQRISWLNYTDEEIRYKGIEAIILGWGLTAALISLLMVTPLALVMPDMLWKFLYPQGAASVLYLLVVTCCDVSFDMLSLVMISYICKCDFGTVLGNHPFSKTLQSAYLASLTVVWAPCALGCFGWVFQHMCVAAFANQCRS